MNYEKILGDLKDLRRVNIEKICRTWNTDEMIEAIERNKIIKAKLLDSQKTDPMEIRVVDERLYQIQEALKMKLRSEPLD